ncbi:MAG: DUF2489 domain-containing protein [Porticoccaceae bacterium]
MNLWIMLGLLVIAGLGGYAIYLQMLLQRQKKARQAQEKQLAEIREERHQHYRKSIQVIAAAIEADQVTLTEGAIRISMLVTQLELDEQESANYQVFFQLAEATAHIPILEEWKKLNTRDKLRFDSERTEIEEKYREFVVDAARKLLNKPESAASEPLFYPVGKH